MTLLALEVELHRNYKQFKITVKTHGTYNFCYKIIPFYQKHKNSGNIHIKLGKKFHMQCQLEMFPQDIGAPTLVTFVTKLKFSDRQMFLCFRFMTYISIVLFFCCLAG